MNTDYIYGLIPSFYNLDLIKDENGNNPFSSIFDIYSEVLGDALARSIQNINALSLERIEPITYDYNYLLDISDNTRTDLPGLVIDSIHPYIYYLVDDNLTGFDDLYTDVFYANRVPSTFGGIQTYKIFKDLSSGKKYCAILVTYLNSLITKPNYLFAKIRYSNDGRLANTYGILVNDARSVIEYSSIDISGKFYTVDRDITIANLITYKKELLGLYFTMFNGATLKAIQNGLSIFAGYKYAEFDGIITDIITGSPNKVTVTSLDNSKIQTYSFNESINSDIYIGKEVSRFDILSIPAVTIIDYFSDPVAFKNNIITNISSLIGVNTSIGEDYANLNWDNPNIIWDSDCSLYWDMGTWESGCDPFLTESPFGYEMFHNTFIITSTLSSSDWLVKFTNFLDKIKPIYTKYILLFI